MANNKINDYVNSLQEDADFVSANKLTQFEREFYLNYSEYDKCWYAESTIPKYWRLLEKRNWECTGVQYYRDGTVCSKTFKSNSTKGVTITDPTRKGRELTDEQRQAARERLMAYHNNKSKEE